ncbi:hypothetical protein ACFQ0B_29070 [Nonomuraea thailandensis]
MVAVEPGLVLRHVHDDAAGTRDGGERVREADRSALLGHVDVPFASKARPDHQVGP